MTAATMRTATAAVATTTAAASVTTPTAASDKFNVVRGGRLLFVEDIEGRQANVGDFFFTKMHVSDCRRWHCRCGFGADYSCGTGQRQRGSDQRYRARLVSLGSSL
jgi:hypothetical protein